LRVEVDQQDGLAGGGQGGGEVDGGGGLADAAFLVGDGEDAARPGGSGAGSLARRLKACF
jgi:hypothetical protein